ncbi:hypothetical protein HC024_14060 [Methylococcaceae bacterium WWC4]|nr:hypothetical protein [Methylococcaceae bacterium WWC4]
MVAQFANQIDQYDLKSTGDAAIKRSTDIDCGGLKNDAPALEFGRLTFRNRSKGKTRNANLRRFTANQPNPL